MALIRLVFLTAIHQFEELLDVLLCPLGLASAAEAC